MLNKKLMILAIFIIGLFTVSAVSAADNATDDVIGEDNGVVDVVSIYEDEDYLELGSEATLINKISSTPAGGTLYLDQDYSFILSDDWGIEINKAIIIDGKGHYIDVKHSGRLFKITGDGVTLKNIKFYSGNATLKGTFSYGGAIYWDADYGNIINCSFYDNYAKGYGGAIYAYCHYANMTDCNFYNNWAYGGGGAIEWSGEHVLISNCNFYNNYAIGNGGAVRGFPSHSNIIYCNFYNNSAKSGGAISDRAGYGKFIRYCNFTNNFAEDEGGAIFSGINHYEIEYCNFYNNSASRGGAIHSSYVSNFITSCNFTNNQAHASQESECQGGAIYNLGHDGRVDRCIFINNDAINGMGGAIYLTSYDFEYKNNIFKDNSAKMGGAMYFADRIEENVLENSTFSNDIAQLGSEIFWNDSLCGIIDCSFNGKKSDYNEYFGINTKIAPNIEVDIKNITGKENLHANISIIKNITYKEIGYYTIPIIQNMCGNLICNLYDSNNKLVFTKNYEVSFSKYSFNLDVSNLTPESYTLDIIYTGDNIYEKWSKSIDVRVYKFNSSITFDAVSSIMWGSQVKITPVVNSGATGQIEIKVNGVSRAKISVGSSYTLTNLEGPVSRITATYLGDKYYDASSYEKTITVTRYNSNLEITGNLEDNNVASIYVSLNSDATGKVNVTIQGITDSGNLKDGSLKFTRSGLCAKEYNVLVSYGGDSKYNSFSKSATLHIDYKPSAVTLNVNQNNVLIGNNVVITPYVTSGASGSLDIYVDNIKQATIDIGSKYTLQNPSAGEHQIRVVYNGDNYYSGSENTAIVKVFGLNSIEVQNNAIVYGSGKHFQAIFYDESGVGLANQYVTFRFNGENTIVKTNEKGLAIFNKDLPIGNYSITCIHPYVDGEKTSNLQVFSSVQTQDMTITYNGKMEFKARLFDETANPLRQGSALFNLNGKSHTIQTDNDGFAVLDLSLGVGTYGVTVTNVLTGESKSNKITILSSINANDMIRGYNSGIDFKARLFGSNSNPLSNQKVAFIINNIEYESTTDANGYAVLNKQLNVGKYKVTIVNKVTGERITKDLTIKGRIVGNEDNTHIYGEESYYTVRIVGDDGNFVGANEKVNIKINNVNHEIKTNNNGYASYKIDESSGFYEISAEYKNYIVKNEVHVLQKVYSVIDFKDSNINYTQNGVINLELSSFDNNANLEIEISGENGYHEVFYKSASKTITLPVSGLDASKYNISAKYYDLNNNKFSSIVKTFTISKTNPVINVVVENANVGETARITVSIPNVSGHVSIKIGNAVRYDMHLAMNEVIIKEIDPLQEGNYQVEVTYYGDNNYNMVTKSAELLITQPMSSTNIIASSITTTYGKTAYLTATLKDSNGKAISGAKLTVRLSNGKTVTPTTDSNGQVKVSIGGLTPKTIYTAAITFEGNSKYLNSTKSVKITVNKATPKLTASAKTYKVKATKKYTVTLKNNNNVVMKSTKLTLKVNGKTYSATTNAKGQATFTLSKLTKKGKYTAIVSYAGNKYYNAKTVKPIITVK